MSLTNSTIIERSVPHNNIGRIGGNRSLSLGIMAALAAGQLEEPKTDRLEKELRDLINEHKAANPGKSYYLLVQPLEGATPADINTAFENNNRDKVHLQKLEDGSIRLVYTPEDGNPRFFKLQFLDELPPGEKSIANEFLSIAPKTMMEFKFEKCHAPQPFFETKPRYKEWEVYQPRRSKKNRRNHR